MKTYEPGTYRYTAFIRVEPDLYREVEGAVRATVPRTVDELQRSIATAVTSDLTPGTFEVIELLIFD